MNLFCSCSPVLKLLTCLLRCHSVSYLRLPDLFIAFDLYDRATGTFHDRNRLNAALDNTSISTTPILYSGPALCKSNLIAMIERQSQFAGEGVRMEGVYVKIEGNGKVLERCVDKVYREDAQLIR